MSVFNHGAAGIGNVGSYQVSGKPFVSGAIDVNDATVAGTPLEITFPSVTRWILVRNLDNSADNSKTIKVAASATGFDNNNFFTLNDDYSGTFIRKSTTPRLELKLTKIYLTGSSTKVDVIAGLTNIPINTIPDNWEGSDGVG
jgi:hypothetical protein